MAAAQDPPPDRPLEVEECLIMKAKKDSEWASEPILERSDSTERESFRRCFRQFRYVDVTGPHEAFSKLWELCCRWLKPETRSKEQMLEQLVIEQFLTILPEKMQVWAQKQCPESGEEAVALVVHLEKESGRLRQPEVSSPVPLKKQAPLRTVWEVSDFEPKQVETQRRGASQAEARSLHSGLQKQLSQNREHQPLTKNVPSSLWVSVSEDEWSTEDQEVTTQGPVRDVHTVRSLSYKKSMHPIPTHRDLYQEIRKDSAGNMVSLGGAVSTSNKMARPEQRRAPWSAELRPSSRRHGVLGSSNSKGKATCAAPHAPRRAGKAWREQQPWGLEDEKVAGVHWSYEETKTFLAILKESRFYETLQACPRNSQVYGAVAEWLRECGFLRTPEQCRTKFKSLQKSYRKVRNGHMLEPCAFFEDMDALLNPAAQASSTDKPKAVVSLPRLKRTGVSANQQVSVVDEDEGAEESDGDEVGIEFIRKSEIRGAPVLFQNLSGVHWGYEETKTFLDILRETHFYEALQACHRKSKLYGAVAEQLRDCGFFRTPEQCRTKFKSLQKSYRKVKNGHVLEPCAFYREMDALVNSRAAAPSASTSEQTSSPSRQERGHIEEETQDPAGWEPEESSQGAVIEDSDSERMSEEEILEEPEFQRPTGLSQSQTGFDTGNSIKEYPTQVIFKDTEPYRALIEKSRRSDSSKCFRRECISGRQWENLQEVRQGKLMSQPRDLGRAVVHQKPFVGKRPYRLLKYGEGFGRGARLPCRATLQKENPYKCSACGKCFGRSRSLIRHQRIHAGEKPFKCLDCGKSFNVSSNFGAHQRIHTGEKPPRCGECAKGFGQSLPALQRAPPCADCGNSFAGSSHFGAHRRGHAGETPNRCGDCARSREQRRAHAGEKPFPSAQCGRRFARSAVLARHRDAHLREKPLPCPAGVCPPESLQRGRARAAGALSEGDPPAALEGACSRL